MPTTSYSNVMIGKLALSGWLVVTFKYSEKWLELLTVPNATSHPSVSSIGLCQLSLRSVQGN